MTYKLYVHTLFWLVYYDIWKKQQAGSEASTTCNLSALPSNVDSKSQTKLVDSTDCSQDVSYYIHVAI